MKDADGRTYCELAIATQRTTILSLTEVVVLLVA